MTRRKLPKVPRACANEDCPNPVPNRPGAWLCEECLWKEERYRELMENLQDDYWMRKIDKLRGK